MIVLDFLSSRGSAAVATLGVQAGLSITTVFGTAQLPDACGYLAAGWACLMRENLRHEGIDFTDVCYGRATQFNSAEFIAYAHERLANVYGAQPRYTGTDASRLEIAEIQALASQMNPDGTSDVPWLSGPSAFNNWRAHFVSTLVQPDGEVHIEIVNSVVVGDLAHNLAAAEVAGDHWFVVAWLVERVH